MSKGERRVFGIVLAAGESTRMGVGPPKQVLPFEGEPFVRRIARQALSSRLAGVVVVVGFAADEVRTMLTNLDVLVVENPRFAEGQSTSVKAGLDAVESAADAAMFIPVDHPFLTAGVIDRIISGYEETGGRIVVPAYKERRGAPVLFDRSLFPELAQITGDEGGRQLFQQHSDDIVAVSLDSERPLRDIDTWADYKQLLRKQ